MRRDTVLLLASLLSACTGASDTECPEAGDGGADTSGVDTAGGDGGSDGGGDGGGGDGGGGDGDGGDGARPIDEQDGTCDSLVYSTEVEGLQRLYDGRGEGALALQSTRVVETAEEWAAILSASKLHGASPASPDFDTHRVLVAGYWISSTCGLSLRQAEVMSNNYGGPHLEVTIRDLSAGCKDACSATDGYVYAVAVPREAGDPPTVCRRVEPGCE